MARFEDLRPRQVLRADVNIAPGKLSGDKERSRKAYQDYLNGKYGIEFKRDQSNEPATEDQLYTPGEKIPDPAGAGRDVRVSGPYEDKTKQAPYVPYAPVLAPTMGGPPIPGRGGPNVPPGRPGERIGGVPPSLNAPPQRMAAADSDWEDVGSPPSSQSAPTPAPVSSQGPPELPPQGVFERLSEAERLMLLQKLRGGR